MAGEAETTVAGPLTVGVPGVEDYARRRVRRVISLGANTRKGGPQNRSRGWCTAESDHLSTRPCTTGCSNRTRKLNGQI